MYKTLFRFLPTAGDMEREPEEPVGDGVGRVTCCEFGVPGAAEPTPLWPPPLELSLLFWLINSCKRKTEEESIY